MAVEKIFQDALALPREDRARLLTALAVSLEPGGEARPTEAEWEGAWTAEVDRRLRDFDEGRSAAISHEEFKSRARARLR
ncbi:MAG TPA: addiction module protein [Kofleriaceae bacterium]|nr:addiction module protein [Kofleriaceae bacterium]